MNKIALFSTALLFLASCGNNDTDQEIIATSSVEEYSKENCSRAEAVRLNPEAHTELRVFDTLCTKVDLTLVKIETPSKAISDKINQAILANICDKYGFGEENYTSIEGILNSVNDDEDGFDVTIHSEIVTNKNNVLCVSISFETYAFGAAHPYSYCNYYNFDLATGKIITLESLVNSTDPAFTEIGKKNFIKENGEEGWNFSEDGEFKLSPDFAITEQGLLFSYNAYEIGAYAMGAPEFLIQYDEIPSLIKKDGLLNKFVK